MGSHRVRGAARAQRITGDTVTCKLLGAQLVGHLSAQVSKRVDIFATTIFYGGMVDDIPDLDLSYTPPLGSPYDAIQHAALAGSTISLTDPLESRQPTNRDAARTVVHTDAMGNLSPELTGPVQLELARAVEQLPGRHGMPGGSRYELKWDGFLH
jgi:hypothetical protein